MNPKNLFLYILSMLLFVALIAMPATLLAQTGSSEKNFRYWFERGALLSVYGNQDAAVHAFNKAIELEPGSGEAYFSLGVAYAERGDYEKGIRAVNMAISLNPEVSRYLYGRAWIHMRANNFEHGILDMKEAAQRHNEDAIRYLEGIAARHHVSY